MSAPDKYMGRVLRHRNTGHVAVIDGEAKPIVGFTMLRLRFGDGALSKPMTVATIEADWEWLDGLTAVEPPPVVALPDNVVVFPGRRVSREIPIGPGAGDAA